MREGGRRQGDKKKRSLGHGRKFDHHRGGCGAPHYHVFHLRHLSCLSAWMGWGAGSTRGSIAVRLRLTGAACTTTCWLATRYVTVIVMREMKNCVKKWQWSKFAHYFTYPFLHHLFLFMLLAPCSLAIYAYQRHCALFEPWTALLLFMELMLIWLQPSSTALRTTKIHRHASR